MRIVVRTPNWIGDQVMARDFYLSLRRAYSKSEITLLGPKAVLEVPLGIQWEEARALSADERRANFAGLRGLRRYLREKNFDLAISLAVSWSATLPFALAGIANRVGFDQSGTHLLLTSYLRWIGRASGKPKSELYLDLARFLGAQPFLGSEPKSEATEKLLVLAPGASISLRVWPGFERLAILLRKNHPEYRIAVVGTAADKIEWLSRPELSGIENFVGGTSVSELVELFKKAKWVIANDSGPAHLAASLAGAPTLVLMGPGDPNYILPKGSSVQSVRLTELGCSPCESARCLAPFGYKKCLNDLSVETVFARLGL